MCHGFYYDLVECVEWEINWPIPYSEWKTKKPVDCFDQILRNRLKHSIFELPCLVKTRVTPGGKRTHSPRRRCSVTRQHTYEYVNIRSIRQHTSAYASICVDDVQVTDDAERLRCSTMSQHCVTVSTVSCLDTV